MQEDREVLHEEASREVAAGERREDVVGLAIAEEERHEVGVASQAAEEFQEVPAPTSALEVVALAEDEAR